MKKEKIVLGNKTEIPYDLIGIRNGKLVVSFVDGNAVELECLFRDAGQNNLEEIQQMDANGNVQTVHRLYDILEAVVKQINAGKLDSGETVDIVEILLAPETEMEARVRHLEASMRAQEEVTDTILMEQLG